MNIPSLSTTGGVSGRGSLGLPPLPAPAPTRTTTGGLQPTGPVLPSPATPSAPADPVGNAFSSLLNGTINAEHDAQRAIETGLLGGDVTQAEVMSAVKKADLSVRMLMQIRNKVLNAYSELQAMKF